MKLWQKIKSFIAWLCEDPFEKDIRTYVETREAEKLYTDEHTQ